MNMYRSSSVEAATADDFAELDALMLEDFDSPGPSRSVPSVASLPEPLPTATAIEPDDQLPSGSYRLPRAAEFGLRRRDQTLDDIRRLSRLTLQLEWQTESVPGISDGEVSSNFSLYNLRAKKLRAKRRGSSRTFFPTHHAVPVPLEGMTTKLPAWKNATSEELLFGLRVASVAFDGRTAGPEAWGAEHAEDDVGFLSFDLRGNAAERFLSGERGSAAQGLRRGLLRALQSAGEVLGAAACWVAPHDEPGAVTLFLALQARDFSAVEDAIEVDAARRYIATHTSLSQVNWWDYQDYSGEPGEPGLRSFAGRVWLNTVHGFGMPSWFTSRFLRTMRDYLLTDEAHVNERKRIVANIKKRRWTRAAIRRLRELECMELVDAVAIRFYRGSPAQFAAAAFSRGRFLGAYTDTRHKAGLAKELYEEIRRGSVPSAVS